MNSSYIIKKLDSCGRLTLPKELREQLNLNETDELRLSIDGDRLILERIKPLQKDLFDNIVSEPLYNYHGKKIARSSIIELASLAGLLSE